MVVELREWSRMTEQLRRYYPQTLRFDPDLGTDWFPRRSAWSRYHLRRSAASCLRGSGDPRGGGRPCGAAHGAASRGEPPDPAVSPTTRRALRCADSGKRRRGVDSWGAKRRARRRDPRFLSGSFHQPQGPSSLSGDWWRAAFARCRWGLWPSHPAGGPRRRDLRFRRSRNPHPHEGPAPASRHQGRNPVVTRDSDRGAEGCGQILVTTPDSRSRVGSYGANTVVAPVSSR